MPKHQLSKRLPVGLTVIGILIAIAVFAAADKSDPTLETASPTVRSFGATGDGQTDDTDAIQQAVDAGIGDVILPRGVYRITRPIVVDLDRVGFTAFVGHGAYRHGRRGAGHSIGRHARRHRLAAIGQA
jgi:hypothetical protein